LYVYCKDIRAQTRGRYADRAQNTNFTMRLQTLHFYCEDSRTRERTRRGPCTQRTPPRHAQARREDGRASSAPDGKNAASPSRAPQGDRGGSPSRARETGSDGGSAGRRSGRGVGLAEREELAVLDERALEVAKVCCASSSSAPRSRTQTRTDTHRTSRRSRGCRAKGPSCSGTSAGRRWIHCRRVQPP
jgi:hypothetical protein